MLIKLLNLDNLLLSLIILFLLMSLTYSEEVFIEIDNPRFSEKGLSDKTYEIKAEKGLKSDNELKLFAIEGKFKTVKDGKWIYLEADKGNFSQDNNFIELQENIIFYTDEGEKLLANYATFDISNDIILCEKLAKNNTTLLGNINFWILSPKAETQYTDIYRKCLLGRNHQVLN